MAVHKFKHGCTGDSVYSQFIYCEYCGHVAFYANNRDNSRAQEEAKKPCPNNPGPQKALFKDICNEWREKFPAVKEAVKPTQEEPKKFPAVKEVIKPQQEEEPKKFTCMDCVHCYVSDMPMTLGEPRCRKHRTGWNVCKGNDFERKKDA